MTIRPYFALVTLLIGLTDCKKTPDDPTIACDAPTSLAAQAPCESGYPGALLISSGYKTSSSTQFIYYVYPQKDSLSSDLNVKGWANASNERIIVPETALGTSPRFIVRVTINCNGKDIPSRYFSFIKQATTANCYHWVLQSQ